MADVIKLKRAPVLTLWAAVVAECLGFDWEEALTLGCAVAGLKAYSKGVSLGRYKPAPESEQKPPRPPAEGEVLQIDLLHRGVPAVKTTEGLRALCSDRPISPAKAERYLHGKLGDRLDDARKAMERLAQSLSKEELVGQAFAMYERFRPAIPAGLPGCGAAGNLDLDSLSDLAN